MAVKKIEHVGIMVSNMEASIAFYRDIIGLELFDRLDLENGVVLGFLGFANAKETVVELVEIKDGAFAEEGRVHHIAFTVENIEAEIERLKGLNVTFINENISTLPNGSNYIFFYGPDQERIEFFEPGK
ncbi:VOC family protein [Halalkalibacter urbisdiaboli]|uniref:VOC family protein n=1 Tax=Halalkalibacter urbisdiaboli TaxID=1960589 RepID=UPI000B43C862|nr:VOC family protein [Halalkalibacter urbisdiaboli]